MPQSKTCVECGAEFTRPPHRSHKQWAIMRCCSTPCANAQRAKHSNPMRDAEVRRGHGHKVRSGWAASKAGRRAIRTRLRKARAKRAKQAARNQRLQLQMWSNECRSCGAPIKSWDRLCAMCALSRKQDQRKQWKLANPDYTRRYKRQYVVLRDKAAGTCNETQARARYDYYGGGCAYCRQPIPLFDQSPRTWHWDHVIPLSKGGTAWPSNLRPACADCNRRKCAKNIVEFLAAG